MLKLKFQYFGYLMRRTDSLEKTLKLGKTEGRRRGWQKMRGLMASPTQWTWVWASSGRWWWTGKTAVLQSMGSQSVGHDWVIELNWTEPGIAREGATTKRRRLMSSHKLISKTLGKKKTTTNSTIFPASKPEPEHITGRRIWFVKKRRPHTSLLHTPLKLQDLSGLEKGKSSESETETSHLIKLNFN